MKIKRHECISSLSPRTLGCLFLAGVIGASTASTVLGTTIIDDDFTSNPSGNGWETIGQGDDYPTGWTITSGWDNSTNYVVKYKKPTGSTWGGAGIVNSLYKVDMSTVDTVTQRLTFGKSGTDTNSVNYQRLFLGSSADQATYGGSYYYVSLNGANVTVVNGRTNQSIFSNYYSAADHNKLFPVAAGDWVQVTYGKDKLESLSYYDSGANNGQGALLNLYQDDPNTTTDDKAMIDDFSKFTDGGYTAVEIVNTAGPNWEQKGVWDRVTTTVTVTPEPGALGFLGVGGLLLMRRRATR